MKDLGTLERDTCRSQVEQFLELGLLRRSDYKNRKPRSWMRLASATPLYSPASTYPSVAKYSVVGANKHCPVVLALCDNISTETKFNATLILEPNSSVLKRP